MKILIDLLTLYYTLWSYPLRNDKCCMIKKNHTLFVNNMHISDLYYIYMKNI